MSFRFWATVTLGLWLRIGIRLGSVRFIVRSRARVSCRSRTKVKVKTKARGRVTDSFTIRVSFWSYS